MAKTYTGILLDDVQASLVDVVHDAELLLAALKNAESCETSEDCRANLDEALNSVRGIQAAIVPLRHDLDL